MSLLNLPQEVKGAVKKKLTAFYDLRSAFVHGGLQFAHPASVYPLDQYEHDRLIDRIMRCADFGATIVVATLQQLIEREWTGIDWQERPTAPECADVTRSTAHAAPHATKNP